MVSVVFKKVWKQAYSRILAASDNCKEHRIPPNTIQCDAHYRLTRQPKQGAHLWNREDKWNRLSHSFLPYLRWLVRAGRENPGLDVRGVLFRTRWADGVLQFLELLHFVLGEVDLSLFAV
jgi:hypothetical protein